VPKSASSVAIVIEQRKSEDQLQTELQFAHIDAGAKAVNRTKAPGARYRHACVVDGVAGE